MNVEDVVAKLRSVHGEDVDRLWYAYLASAPETKRVIETRLRQMLDAALRAANGVLLETPPPHSVDGEYVLGTAMAGAIAAGSFGLRETDWIQHVNIFGRSGAGKTNLVFLILWNFVQHAKPFLVFDWKRNYRDFLTVDGTDGVQLFTVGRDVRPFRFNPWLPPTGIAPDMWARKLIDVLCHAYFAGEGVADVLLRAAEAAYAETASPTTAHVLRHLSEIKDTPRQVQWKTSAFRILRAMSSGSMRGVTNVGSNDHLPQLLDEQVILEVDALSDADKVFMTEALLLWIHQYRLVSTQRREEFRHAIVIEEAHHVLLKHPTLGAEPITDVLLREIRELGEAVITVDQHPSLITLPAVGNSFATICFNLKHDADVVAGAACMLLPHDERRYLGLLEPGQAIVKLQGRHLLPFRVSFPRAEIPKGSVTDEQLRCGSVQKSAVLRIEGLDFEMVDLPGGGYAISVPKKSSRPRNGSCSGYSASKLAVLPNSEDVRVVLLPDKREEWSVEEGAFLKNIVSHPLCTTRDRYKQLGVTAYQGNQLLRNLLKNGWVLQFTVGTRDGRVVLLALTDNAKRALGVREKNVGVVHRFWQDRIATMLRTAGYEVVVEPMLHGYEPDLIARRDGRYAVIEVETGASDFVNNCRRAQRLPVGSVVILATSQQAKEVLEAKLPNGVRIMLAREFTPEVLSP